MAFNSKVIKKLLPFKGLEDSDYNLSSDGIITINKTVKLSKGESFVIPYGLDNAIISVKRKIEIENRDFIYLSQDNISCDIEINKNNIEKIYKLTAYGGNYNELYNVHFIRNGQTYMFDSSSRQWLLIKNVNKVYAGTPPLEISGITEEEWGVFYKDCRSIVVSPFFWSCEGTSNFGRYKLECRTKSNQVIDETKNFIITPRESETEFRSLVSGDHEYRIVLQKSLKQTMRG